MYKYVLNTYEMYESILKLTFSSKNWKHGQIEVNNSTKVVTKIETTLITILCSNNINEGITCC